MLNKLLEKFGYVKASRTSEVIGESKPYSFLYGENQPANYSKFLKAYADETWVYICVYLISNSIAGLPYKLQKVKVANNEEVAEDTYNRELLFLFDNVNDFDENSNWSNLIEFTCANMELTGNAYWLLDDLVDNKPTNLMQLIASKVSIEQGGENKLVGKYHYSRPDGQKKTFFPEEILHFKYINPSNYFYGQGSFSAGRVPVEIYSKSMESNLKIFRNGRIGIETLQTDQSLSPQNYQRLLNQIKDNYAGSQNAHKLMILENGMKYDGSQLSMHDLDYVNGQKLTREDICGIFGVPPILAGNLDKATYSNYKESEKIFWKSTLIPKIRHLENSISNLAKRYDPSYRFKFDLTNVEALKEDMKEKAEIAKIFFDMGVPYNEIIKALNLPFQPDKKTGDTGLISFSLVPKGEIGKEEEAPAGEEGKTLKKKFEYTEEKKEEIWKRHIDLTGRYEKGYIKIIAKFFNSLKDGVLNRLKERYKDYKFVKESANSDAIKKDIDSDIEYILYNGEREAKIYSQYSIKVLRMALEESGKRQLLNMGVGNIGFDVHDPKVVNWLKDYSLKQAKLSVDTNREKLREILSNGFQEGLTETQIGEEIATEFSGYENWKAERIARTEINASANKGRIEAMRDAGVTKKFWLTARDERVRETHIEAERKYKDGIPLDEEFNVGKGSCVEPGNTGLAEEDINCRCSAEVYE